MKTSVILTNYNYSKFIVSAITSLFSQTVVPDEIIIVDDASTDDSVAVVKDYIKHTPPKVKDKFKFIERDKNGGPAASRNSGIAVATGDVLCFLDADDFYYPRKIEASLNILKEYPQIGLVYTDYEVLDKDSKLTREFKTSYDARYLWQACIVSTNSIIRREVIDKVGIFNEKYRGTEDYEYWLRIATQYLLYHVPEPLFCYRLHGQNITSVTPTAKFASDIKEFKDAIRRGLTR